MPLESEGRGSHNTVVNSLFFFKYLQQVFIKSRFIMNGVCVVWKGWLDLQRLDGAGYLEFDEDKAKVSLLTIQLTSFLTFLLFQCRVFLLIIVSQNICIPCNYIVSIHPGWFFLLFFDDQINWLITQEKV